MNILLIIRLTLIHCLFTLVRAKLKQNVDDSVVSISADFYNDIINQYSNNYNSYEHVSQCSFGFQRYRPNRKNCNHFYVCNTENQYQTIGQQSRESSVLIGVCPPNMWFDADHSDNDEVICTHYEVICASKHTEMYNYCNCKAIKATASSTGHQQANIETDDSLNEESISCIVDNEFHLFESEKYCERYYICFNTKVYPMKCKPGLHFNPTMKYCDVPEKAQCKVIFFYLKIKHVHSKKHIYSD